MQSGFLATTICFGLAVALILSLRFVMMWDNARRDAISHGASPVVEGEDSSLALTDQTDKENLHFRYLL